MPGDLGGAHGPARPSSPSQFLDTASDPLAGASSGRLCWAVNVREWEPEADELDFLLSLIPTKSERQRVERMNTYEGKKVCLAARLLMYRACAAVLGHKSFDDITIERTSLDKPFLKRPRPPWEDSGALGNFNFNISHHGPWVVLVSDPLCICGVDVASPDAVFSGFMVDIWATSAEQDDAMQESTSKGSTYRQEHFQRLWTCKEALVKARGDGIRFDMSNCEFRLCEDPTVEPLPGAWRYTAKASIHGKPALLWRIHQQRIGSDFWVSLARGPTSGVADSADEFFATLRRPTEEFSKAEWKAVLREPPPPLTKVPVSFLVPEDDFEEYQRCLDYGIQIVD